MNTMTQNGTTLPCTYAVRTLGYQMSEHDSERMAGLLEQTGLTPVEQVPGTVAHVTDAGNMGTDVIVINTCSARENTTARLFDNLDQLASVKRMHPGMQIAVGDCLTQQMRGDIVQKAPWVDAVFGTHNIDVLPALLRRAEHNRAATIEIEGSLKVLPSILPTHRGSAYAAQVSISVGYDNTCTFCIVPHLRGKEHDRHPGDTLVKVGAVASQGTIEMTLLGQNVSSYGVGFGKRGTFAGLLRAVGCVEGIEHVRFTLPHPTAFADDVIAAMAQAPTVILSLHIPLQSGSGTILRQMRRSYHHERFVGILERVRAAIPEVAITTDIIVDFPGETEEDFQATLDVVGQARFSSAFTFLYSPRPGMPATSREGQMPDDVALKRYQRLVELQECICAEDDAASAGTKVEIPVSGGDCRKDGATHRISGRARDNHLVRVALPEEVAEEDRPRPGDMIRAIVTYSTPHHLVTDSGTQDGLFEVHRTRTGNTWEARQTSDEPDNTVSLSIPTLRVRAPN